MNKRRIIVLSEDVLYEQGLSLAEKVVYARIAGFEEYYESADECAKLLGISASTVQKAKQKLEKLGYIACLRNTGRGKTYRAVLDRQSDTQNLPIRLAKSANQTSKFCQHRIDRDKNIDVLTNASTGDEVASATKSNSQKASRGIESVSSKTYGNSAINSMFAYWQEKTGQAIISRRTANRRACYNLLRNRQVGEEKLRHAVDFIGETVGDKFAPRVSDFVDLQAKFNALCDYKNRRDQQTPTGDDKTPQKRNGAVSGAYNARGGYVPFVPNTYDARQVGLEAEQKRWREAENNRADDGFVQKLYSETMSKLKGKQ